MITRHYKRIVKDILQRGGAKYDAYAVTASDGRPYYTAQEQPNYSSDQTAMSMSTDQPGVIIGNGTAAESETSYWLVQQITSGFTGSVMPIHEMVDGTHTLCLYVTIANTGSSSITVSEIGYALITPLMRRPSDSQFIGSPYAVERNVLIDRTVLASPITIAAGSGVRLKYALKTTDEIFSGSVVLIQKTINVNGVYNASSDYADGYSEVTVSVTPNLQSKTVMENGTVTPDQGYEGLSSVVVNVSGGGDIPWNENILCNWDFTNIVNTRGASSYSSGYGFDGWSVFQGTVVLGQGGIYIRKAAAQSFMLSGQFLSASAAVQALYGKTLTISALVDDQFGSYTFTASSSGERDQGHLTVNGIDFYFYRDSSTQMPFYMLSESNDNDNKLIRAVKVEFGATQTLARQVNGVWTLNKTGIQNEEYFRVRAMVKNS